MTFTWVTIRGPVRVVNGNQAEIAGSQYSFLDSSFVFSTGSDLALPITDNAVYPTLAGPAADGYDIFIRPNGEPGFAGSFNFELGADRTFSPVFVTISGSSVGLRFDSTAVNRPPIVGVISAPSDPAQVNTTINATATFSDPDVTDAHTAVWDWGDGMTSAGSLSESNGNGSVISSHQYTAAGVYTVTLTVTDNHGAPGQAFLKYIVIYDPNAGHVTGGGKINSPGAALVGTTVTGQAKFGFNARYQSGATVPTGQAEFNFPSGNFNFHSVAYQVLVVSGFRSQVTGTGTVNGASGYGFRLTAYDGDLPGGGGTDRFRIRVWNTGTGAVVYDNVPDAPDNLVGANPQAIANGNTVIHSQPLEAAGGVDSSRASGDSLSAGQLQLLVSEAIARWRAAGTSTELLSGLEELRVEIAALPAPTLGLTAGGVIWLSPDAAGQGWFIDPTPGNDSEFNLPGDQGEHGRMDLLSVVAHELGHVLGFEHSHENDVMEESLEAGVRRMPASIVVGHVLANDSSGLSAALSLSQLPPKSVVAPSVSAVIARATAGQRSRGRSELVVALLSDSLNDAVVLFNSGRPERLSLSPSFPSQRRALADIPRADPLEMATCPVSRRDLLDRLHGDFGGALRDIPFDSALLDDLTHSRIN